MCIRVGQALTGQRGNITALGIDAVDFKHHLNTERWWSREGWDADISSPLQIRWWGGSAIVFCEGCGKGCPAGKWDPIPECCYFIGIELTVRCAGWGLRASRGEVTFGWNACKCA